MSNDLARRRRASTICVAALTAAAVLAPAASAADRTAEMDGSNVFEWSASGPSIGVVGDAGLPCGTLPGETCDETLIHLQHVGGELTIATKSDGASPIEDWDVELYASDASASTGALAQESASAEADEQIVVQGADEEYYLLVLRGYTALGSTTGSITYRNPALPLSKIGKLAKKVKSSKLKKIGGTASSEGGSVSQVEVAIVKAADCPSTCEPTNWVAAKGTSKWSLKLKKKLKKGKYVVLSRATDESGVQETEFSTAAGNRKEVTVR